MASEYQDEPRTRFVLTQGVREYRATIPWCVTAEDRVLEVGMATVHAAALRPALIVVKSTRLKGFVQDCLVWSKGWEATSTTRVPGGDVTQRRRPPAATTPGRPSATNRAPSRYWEVLDDRRISRQV